ncbi:GTP:AMP phosphotransferase, putative [Plasmodium chabaudi chabaudi]|uniref:GTP:AMP phosphotransferase, putative n=1 Tax=Plasmodium chabaudi chabaudi TaxID=31271 RepID=A0A4V6M958_PLACU|nr:GTP:AMP phosphotransferase, putative [Plasmodium chabaudi chabaudi]VTZ68137.1 GTP:AMP phosphotransferase, putative [Plasmodium chabaudi chabaudi]|eukprot:XP_744711.1 GTP:AMP phosphotransferase, putative [Plasmodium chabaudi chabaudi]
MRIVLFGAPGVGKGTFAEILAEKEKLKHINIGNILRNEIKKKSSIGKEINKIVNNGNLVPDNIITHIIDEEIKKCSIHNSTNFKGFILDGFPRNINQSKELIKITNIDLFVNIFSPKYILIKKLLGRRICSTCNNCFNIVNIKDEQFDMPPLLPSKDCHICKGNADLVKRSDDSEETILHRLNSYESSNAQIIDFFKNLKYNFIDFEIKKGIKDFDEFHKSIFKYF